MRNFVRSALQIYLSKLEDELPAAILRENNFLSKAESIKQIHFPEDFTNLENAKQTLIYEDFFFQKLFLLKRKEQLSSQYKNRPLIKFSFERQLINNLPFKLTVYQQSAIKEIYTKLFSSQAASILLQGDVGAGKTLVSLFAMLSVVEAGFQCALLVPTEVLALQHYRTIRNFCKILKLNIAVFTGSLKKRERDNLLTALKKGEINIIIGTHCLFSADVEYQNLGLAVVDEQHRFGVEQRFRLLNKGEVVDLILMTATPIPQSLALTLYGDLDLLLMRGTISGRLPVKTWLVDNKQERLEAMHQWIIKTLNDENGRVIFVYPLIEASENNEQKDLETEFKNLEKIYARFNPAFLHSRINTAKKDEIIEDFKIGKIRIIAATTVVEVGLDVPAANIIVVEEADNFGLATLHQLRGRVGRNNNQGYMLLISNLDKLTETGKERLDIICKQTDGFKIAEKDLQLRGPGDYIGSRQSGILNIRLANLERDLDLILLAAKQAEKISTADKDLSSNDLLNTKQSFLLRLKNYRQDYLAAE
jgi:ATP-dependent DNA helicase RecG